MPKEKRLVELSNDLTEECEWFFEELRGLYNDRYPEFTQEEINEELIKVIKDVL